MAGTQTAPAAAGLVNASADGFNSTVYDPESANVLNVIESMLGSNNVGTIPAVGLSNVVAQSIPEWAATSALTLTAGTEFNIAVPLAAGTVINNLSLVIGTAASTPTHSYAGIASFASTSKVLAVSADGLTTAIPTNAVFSFAVPYTILTNGLYFLFFAIAGTTGPTASASVTLGTTGRGAFSFTNGPGATGVTTPPAVAATHTKPTAFAAMPLVYVN